MIEEILPSEAYDRMKKEKSFMFIDVRNPDEYEEIHASNATSMPLDKIDNWKDEVKSKQGQNIYLICRSGKRSMMAASILAENNIENLINITGGTMAWKDDGLPTG